MTVTIRKIQKYDKEIFLTLSREFYSSDAVLAPIPESNHTAAFDELMRSEDYLIAYIFEADGKTAGYALLNKTYAHEAGGFVIWTEELYVRSEYRGQGIAHRYFEMLESSYSPSRFRLETEPENKRAEALYKSLGYEKLPYSQMIKDVK